MNDEQTAKELEEVSASLPTEGFDSLRRTTKNGTHHGPENPTENFKGAGGASVAGCLRHPKPVHETMAHMAVAGYTLQEIASRTGFSTASVHRIVRDPSIRPTIERVLEKTVQEEMKSFLEQEVLPTLHVLKTVRDNPQARPADRISAGRELLDRYLGKAVQPISPDAKPVAEQTDEELRGQVAEALSRMNQPN